MEWWQAVESVTPHVVQISTPRCSGSGFFISSSGTTDICAIATAAHVVGDSHWWEEPIRLFHPHTDHSRILRHSERVIHVRHEMDTAAILFSRQDFPFPPSPLPFIPSGNYLKVGNEIGWVGFPSVSPMNQCFFTGCVSAWIQTDSAYLVDGVSINGVSGGPAFSAPSSNAMLIGVVSAYIPNVASGDVLPGLSVIRDVKQFQELATQFQNLDDASQHQEPPRPPATETPTRTNR